MSHDQESSCHVGTSDSIMTADCHPPTSSDPSSRMTTPCRRLVQAEVVVPVNATPGRAIPAVAVTPMHVGQQESEIPSWIPFAEDDHLPAPKQPFHDAPTILRNVWDEGFGMATVTVHFPVPNTELGLRLKDFDQRCVRLEGIRPTSIFAATHLQESMTILSVNDFDGAAKKAGDMMEFLTSIVGDVTIVAIQEHGIATTSSSSCTDMVVVPPEQPSTETRIIPTAPNLHVRTPPPPPQPPKPMTVTVYKPNKRAFVGISIANESIRNLATSTTNTVVPMIRKVDPKGLCAHSALRPGMIVLSINGLKCYTKDDVKAKMRRAKYMLQFQVVQDASIDPEEEENVRANHGTTV